MFMVRLRHVVKRGGSVYVKLEPSDLKDLSLKLGDEVNIDMLIKIKRRKK